MSKTDVSSERAYRALKDLIETNTLQQGEALSERSVAERLSLSRTPVREAMRALAKEGLLEIVPLRGTFVRQHSIADLREIHEVRLAVEPMAAGLAAQRGATPRLEACVDALRTVLNSEPVDVLAAQTAGWELHDAIFEAADNRRLASIYHAMRSECGLAMRQVAQYDVERTRAAISEHLAIAQAIVERDVEQARWLVTDHLSRAHQSRIDVLTTGKRRPTEEYTR